MCLRSRARRGNTPSLACPTLTSSKHALAPVDFYAAVFEMADIKTGNAIQVERREPRFEYRRDGSPYERPNYSTIAQSKAYRNAVLALVPQDIVIRWKLDMLRLKKEEVITASVIDEKRANVLQFAAQKAIALDRQAVEHLTLDQIAGLGDAAREGRLPAFVEAAKALGLGLEMAQEQAGEPAPTNDKAPPPQGREPATRRRTSTAAPAQTTAPAASETPPGNAPPAGDESGSLSHQDQPAGGTRRRVNFEM